MNRRELMKGAAVAAVAARAQTDGWKPLFFDAHQNETVVALTDLIIPATDTPGARAALVNRHIDLMLSESPAEAQREFLQGLGWLDGYALKKHGAPFARCTAAQQTALLESLDPDRKPTADLRPGTRFFREIKRRTASGYYTSKIGHDELNKGGRVPASFGCPHPGGHAD
ncbi:MAG: gluconate 2-dehydrogenase subunit 3 family protein [Acidobacteria bacterium]|nr:gluconate 2-dehydrogenase subunit 3 family protein [Acidobacteriota bacterium]